MGNCNELCTHDTSISGLSDHKTTTTARVISQIPQEHVVLKCQICGEDKKHTKLKNHLDICHFAMVQQNKNASLDVVCLLCEFKDGTLEQHKNHMKNMHQYMQQVTNKNLIVQRSNQNIESNQNIKKRIKKINKQQYTQKSDKTAEINRQKYTVQTYSQQYGAMEFLQEKAAGDIVWRYVYNKVSDIVYYDIQFQAKQKTILAVSKLFSRVNQTTR